jgi:adenine-specific DNA glycosylase
MLLILDEFGQYASDSFDKFISTCRSANVGVVLSHQTNAQLKTKDGSDRLAVIVRENTATKVILRQSEEADFWAQIFGTKSAYKHTEQTEGSSFGTQKVSQMGTIREVDEFIVHPNTFRQLPVGRAVFKTAEKTPVVINCGMWLVKAHGEIKLNYSRSSEFSGLNLRAERL